MAEPSPLQQRYRNLSTGQVLPAGQVSSLMMHSGQWESLPPVTVDDLVDALLEDHGGNPRSTIAYLLGVVGGLEKQVRAVAEALRAGSADTLIGRPRVEVAAERIEQKRQAARRLTNELG